ncbi:MAG TPA: zf-HC2 domain-containing protein [Chthoniobacterales bacterium]|jgi:anti-sigma factor RsiW|nr:zf-HC2 domain-containing protein [Chthoniobacterales bacterium]
MDCDSANPYLDAFVDGELDPGAERALEQHLRTCSNCQSAVWEIREFRSLFKTSAPRFKAPLELRLRVLNITQRVRAKPSVPEPYAWMAIAAVLIFGAIAVFLVSAPDHGGELSKEAVVDYSRSTSAGPLVELASADFGVLKPWFSDKVGFAPPAIDLHDYGYELAGGRVALLAKRPVVALVYKQGNGMLLIYCWPPDQDPVGYSQRSVDNLRVYIWANSQCNYILVERSDDPKIRQFVDSFQDQTAPVSY